MTKNLSAFETAKILRFAQNDKFESLLFLSPPCHSEGAQRLKNLSAFDTAKILRFAQDDNTPDEKSSGDCFMLPANSPARR